MTTVSQPLDEARGFLTALAEKPPSLPYEPTLLPQLFEATKEDSTASLGDITALIERSQKLATRVLAIANSAVYALESTVTSLKRAISILGFREVRSMVLMVGVVSSIKSAKLPQRFDANGLWRHQIRTAIMAKALSLALDGPARPAGGAAGGALPTLTPDEAYAAGLLHDIGKVTLATIRPAIWETIHTLSKNRGICFADAEMDYWGMDHGLIGSRVLHYWKLPLLLTDTITWHHAPDLAPTCRSEAKLLSAANCLAHHGLVNGELPLEAKSLLPEGVNHAAVAACVDKALQESKENALTGLMS